ncbi:MAG: type II toxin-antitoxin system RelE/ParE family toxin [Planctomycetaceae bacterium]|nr:type II toxin-antitoxin system RelE/ParE family toxin [Planctomycetaceae bacterium]
MRKLLITKEADRDLEQLYRYIAADNVQAADNIIRKLDETFQRLRENPDIGIPQFQLREYLYCKPVARNYLVFYSAPKDSDQLILLRVLHGARDWGNYF